ncbi:Regulator of G-protein signaling 14 [Hondaea fermentalgiana]|uniref:Regulator of G-protein signaling 14 n=1 Tax=Hondaea fermentalgiana TaxID=2315210 RepID=A0A2R5GNJ8_9STRA|nr:Regulator of G-protein signaling 14 [Hondaea fermentalgiana]|eukprot:GBG32466.1 Regulator of G-protein signaling 14 [Hondaea fermentalgiana]
MSRCPSSASELTSVVEELLTCSSAAKDDAEELCSICFDESMENFMANCSSQTLEAFASSLGASLSTEDCNSLPRGCTEGTFADNAATICARKIHAVGTSIECSNSVRDVIEVDQSLSLSGGEADVDCGGPFCKACGDGKSCRRDSDCDITSVCEEGLCFSHNDYVESTTIFNYVTIPMLVVTLLATMLRMYILTQNEEFEKTEARRTRDGDTHRRSSNTTRDDTTKPTTKGTTKGTMHSKRAKYSPPENKSKGATGASAPEVPQTYASLDSVLEDRTARAQFFAFCKSKFAAENILFWDALLRYEDLWKNPTASPEAREQEALMIVETFVSHDASSEVNLSHTLRIELLRLYNRSKALSPGEDPIFRADSFHSAKMEIFRLMNINFFGEFLEHILSKTRGPPMAAAAEGPQRAGAFPKGSGRSSQNANATDQESGQGATGAVGRDDSRKSNRDNNNNNNNDDIMPSGSADDDDVRLAVAGP